MFDSNGIKNQRLINDMTLYAQILKLMHEIDFRKLRYQHKLKQNLKRDLEKYINNCKDYFNSHKQSEIPIDMCTSLLAFFLTNGEYEFLSHLTTQEINVNQIKKPRIEPTIKNSNSGLIEV